MKIVRDGQEIELTEQERRQAYWEQQHIFDVEDIETALDGETDERIEESYGLNREQMNSLADMMAHRLRAYIWKYDMDFEYALPSAIRDVANEYRHGGVVDAVS